MISLDEKPIDELSQTAVFEDPALAESFANEIYSSLGNPFTEQQISSFADDAHFTHGRGSIDIVKASLTPSNLGGWVDTRINFYHWPTIYSNIRDANIFLSNIGDSPIGDEVKDRLTGEVRFLRGFMYWYLLRQWGGVPIVEEVFNLQNTQEELNIPRNTFGETVNFIVEDLDAASELLPMEQTGNNFGRATKGAAMTLKSRVLLFAASDLFHNVPEWADGFSNLELVGYTDGNQQQRWEAARDAAKAVMDLGIYSLHKANPAAGDSIAANYKEIFNTNRNSEAIFSTFFTNEQTFEWYEANQNLFNGPNGYRNWGGNAPTQNLVDEFDMRDGSEFDWNNPNHTKDPYKNRDPRLTADILHDRANWAPRLEGQRPVDPIGVIQSYLSMEVVDDNGNVVNERAGLDTRSGAVEPWNGTFTGYMERKFMDINTQGAFNQPELPYHHMRFAEVLLNYAEASMELGQEQTARDAINRIRRRVDMPEITATGQELVDQYRDERRIELCFEEHRYFDIRRWMIAPTVGGEDAYGINLEARRNQNDPVNVYEYTKVERIRVQERSWADKMYLLPIPRDEINRNDQLVQNPNY